jgi:hypothetical protein
MRMTFAAVALLMATGVMAAPPNPADRAALEKLALDSDRDWDAKALDSFTAHHTADGTVRIAGGETIVGEAAMRSYFGRAFANRPEGFRHVSKVEAIEMIDPDTAVADSYVRVEQRQPDGSWILRRDFRTYSVVVRSKDGWRLRSVRASPLPPKLAA